MSDQGLAVIVGWLALTGVLLVRGLRGATWARHPLWHAVHVVMLVLLLGDLLA